MCPSCNAGGDRALVITPERNLFYCFASKSGGDCIQLVNHITGIPLTEAAEFLLPEEDNTSSTRPPEPQGKAPQSSVQSAPSQPHKKGEAREFDATKFASDLVYTDEVAALGITQEVAARFGIGLFTKPSMRGFVCFPITDGIETHYIGWNGKEFKMPKWQTNVVRLKRA